MRLDSGYWVWQAEGCFVWGEKFPESRWEQFGYFYLFKALGYDGGM